MEYKYCYAQPDSDAIIDVIDPSTGLTNINSESFEQVRQRYPNAQMVPLQAFLEAKAAKQETPIEWVQVGEEDFFAALECVPPKEYHGSSFLNGEPYDSHALSGHARAYGYRELPTGSFWKTNRPVTVTEFRKLLRGPAPMRPAVTPVSSLHEFSNNTTLYAKSMGQLYRVRAVCDSAAAANDYCEKNSAVGVLAESNAGIILVADIAPTCELK